jgi:hypothetical protein
LVLAAGGLAMALPGGGDMGLSHLQLSLAGVIIAAVAIVLAKLGQKAHPVASAV